MAASWPSVQRGLALFSTPPLEILAFALIISTRES